MSGYQPDEADAIRIRGLIRELLDCFADPDTGQGLPGLLSQAWDASPLLLTSRQPQASDGGHSGKPGSRPPVRLDLWSHVQACWTMAREEAHDLGVYFANDRAEAALRKLPDLLEPTYDLDCRDCERCCYGTEAKCVCRHRTVARTVGVHHSTLRTALGWQEPRIDWRDVPCPGCHRKGRVSVRKEQERVWCRYSDCDWHREGALAILAVAS